MTMQTEPELHTSPLLERIATVLRLGGWISFWVELILAALAATTVIFAATGRNFNQQLPALPGSVPGVAVPTPAATPGLGIGIFWAACGLVALVFNIYIAFRITRLARRLRNPNPNVHPKKSEVLQVLQIGVIAGLVGMLLTILGGGATLGILLAKSISQPQAIAIYTPARIIRSLDIFVALANMNGIAANFIATVSSLGLYKWIEHQHR